MEGTQNSTARRYPLLDEGGAVRVQDTEARRRELDESRERWCGRLPTRVLNIVRAYNLTFEEAAAMQDAQLLRLPRFGPVGIRQLRAALTAATACR